MGLIDVPFEITDENTPRIIAIIDIRLLLLDLESFLHFLLRGFSSRRLQFLLQEEFLTNVHCTC